MKTTFDLIQEGDIVIRNEKHSADIRFVEGITTHEDLDPRSPDDEIAVLLSNGVKDLFYEGESGITKFNEEWKLLAKKENLL